MDIKVYFCVTCENLFRLKKGQGDGTKFCSRKCYYMSEDRRFFGTQWREKQIREGRIYQRNLKFGIVGKKPPHKKMCGNCGEEFFTTNKDKIYCSMKCYNTSDVFLEKRRDRNDEFNRKRRKEGLLKYGLGHLGGDERLKKECLYCGIEFLGVKPSNYLKKKYCSRTCYRLFMVERFDRWIADPKSIALPQCYDEFLTEDKLHCLVEGCDWVGCFLGAHVQAAHGILAKDFKKLAGFNVGTGLVVPELADRLSANARERMLGNKNIFPGFKNGIPERTPLSLEGKEHLRKAHAILLSDSRILEKKCIQCGKEFAFESIAPKKYCSVDCRTKFLIERKTKKEFDAFCSWCGKHFLTSRSRLNYNKAKKPSGMYCSIKCRNIGNAQHSRSPLRRDGTGE